MNTTDAVILTSLDHKIVDCNPSATELSLKPQPSGAELREAFPWISEATDPDSIEPSTCTVDADIGDSCRIMEIKCCPLFSKRGHALGKAILIRDVTLNERERAALEHRATRDPLTDASIVENSCAS